MQDLTKMVDLIQVGTIVAVKKGTCPEGWLPVDGTPLWRDEWPELADALEIPPGADTFMMRDANESFGPDDWREVIIKARP